MEKSSRTEKHGAMQRPRHTAGAGWGRLCTGAAQTQVWRGRRGAHRRRHVSSAAGHGAGDAQEQVLSGCWDPRDIKGIREAAGDRRSRRAKDLSGHRMA